MTEDIDIDHNDFVLILTISCAPKSMAFTSWSKLSTSSEGRVPSLLTDLDLDHSAQYRNKTHSLGAGPAFHPRVRQARSICNVSIRNFRRRRRKCGESSPERVPACGSCGSSTVQHTTHRVVQISILPLGPRYRRRSRGFSWMRKHVLQVHQ